MLEIFSPEPAKLLIGRAAGRIGLAHSRRRIARAVTIVSGVIIVEGIWIIKIPVKKQTWMMVVSQKDAAARGAWTAGTRMTAA